MVLLNYSKKAQADLFALWNYYADVRHPQFASHYVGHIVQEFYKTICMFPNMGRLSPEFHVGSRRITIPPYVFFFEVTDPQRITVLRVIDGRRDIRPGRISFLPVFNEARFQPAA